jgi:hypothetical protein
MLLLLLMLIIEEYGGSSMSMKRKMKSGVYGARTRNLRRDRAAL